MTTSERVAFLQEFYRDKLTLRARHEIGAPFVPTYEFNNTYQYIIARENMQLEWVARAIRDLNGADGAPSIGEVLPMRWVE